jgi:hypothetical protein
MNLPKWKPSPLQEVHGGIRSGQRVVGKTEDGTDITVPHLYYEHWLDAAGNILAVPMKTNRVAKVLPNGRVTHGDDGAYYYQIKARMEAAGAVLVESFGDDEAALNAEIEKRRKKHAAESEKFNKAWSADEERKAGAMGRAMADALKVALAKPETAEALTATFNPPAKRKLVKETE